jgi:Variant SH3 domain
MEEAKNTVRVIAEHRASFVETLIFHAGDGLAVEDRETVWSGWVWCTDRSGTGAWVPETYIDRDGDRAVALRDYDSMELNVGEGDVLEVMEEAAGWLWCATGKGEKGWVPAEAVEGYGGDTAGPV